MRLNNGHIFEPPPVILPSDMTRIQRWIRALTKAYSSLLLILFALLPTVVIAYLFLFQDPTIKFNDHAFHELAIGIATLEGAFVTYVAWRCYQYSGEPFLRWLTLGFLGFTLVYTPHGLFTFMAHDHIWLFLLYGPASRFVMALFFFIALLSYGKPPELAERHVRAGYWWKWVGAFMLINVAIGAIALSPIAGHPLVRLSMEGGALGVAVIGIVVLIARRTHKPLMAIFFALSLAYFAQSSLAFILAKPWNHMWWLAHAIFAAGFFILSYGVITAFLSTRAFSTVLSQEQLMAQFRESNARTERALAELRETHLALARQAATDPLTGVSNRRDFSARADIEIARTVRTGAPLSILALDIDHFKQINDRYGHAVGDELLKTFVAKIRMILRTGDIIGRFGGDEFVIALPGSARDMAASIGERYRSEVEANVRLAQDPDKKIYISIGVAEFGLDGNSLKVCLRIADERLYRAKGEGRNRVVAI